MANRWWNNGNSDRLIFLGSKITADGDCSHEIKGHLLLGRKAMTHLATATAAKSLQSCPALCDTIDGSPPGYPVPRMLQERTLEWVAIFFSNAWKWKLKVKSLSRVRLFATPWSAVYQAAPSMGFSRQEYWSGVPLPSPNMLSRFVITFLPRSKRLLISWLQSPSVVILEPPKIVKNGLHCFPIYLPWNDGTGCHDLSFLNVGL